jgi:hypothetical protein
MNRGAAGGGRGKLQLGGCVWVACNKRRNDWTGREAWNGSGTFPKAAVCEAHP